MATNVAGSVGPQPLDAGVASALRINRRIQNDEIPLFIRRCVIDTTRWEVNGTRYEQWRASNRDCHASRWRDEVVIPHLQERFDGLLLREDDRLYGIKLDAKEEIDARFYNSDQLRGCMMAKCEGQRWLFALGCCRRHKPR